MRKHLSVLMLMTRSTIYKVLALLVLMAGAEWLAFRAVFNSALAAMNKGTGFAELEGVLSKSGIAWIFAACFLLMTALLCSTGCEYGSRQGYTLRRLAVPESGVFVWQCVYNTFCFFLLWAAETLTAYGLCMLYMAGMDPAYTSGQTVFLAFYRNYFLHSLLPLADVSRWIRNVLLTAALGAVSAYFPFMQRKGRVAASTIIMAACGLIFFTREIASLVTDLLLMAVSAACIWTAASNVFRRAEVNEET